jgi:beta-barrel assembly-enhancing protease
MSYDGKPDAGKGITVRRDRRRTASTVVMALLAMGVVALGQTELKPGFNLFSTQQDVEIGRQAATEIESQLPLLDQREVQDYVSRIGARLAEHTPGPDFPYQFKVVNVSDVNAFALPGGFMYINRGLVEAAGSEAELAGVMAHEISHVALRHGTNQVSRAYLAQAGLGVLGALLGGGGGGSTAQIVGAVGGFGLNATFLKFSRDAERQADLMGAQILAGAGYDPMAMANFFEQLREMQGRDPSSIERFFSSHPAPADRSQHVQRETQMLQVRERPPVGDFGRIQSRLKGLPKAPSMGDLAQGQSPSGSPSGAPPDSPRDPVQVSIERPSARLTTYEPGGRLFRVRHPSNWEVHESGDGLSVTLAPKGGVVSSGNQEHIVFGALVSPYDPGEGSAASDGVFRDRSALAQTTNQLIAGILRNNPYLALVRGSEGRTRIDGRSGLRVRLEGRSPVTSLQETVELHSVGLTDRRILYLLLIAPERDLDLVELAFHNMQDTLRILSR